MGFLLKKKSVLPTQAEALPGRSKAMPVPAGHYVHQRPLRGPFPAGLEQIIFGLGCFWGAERLFWKLPGVFTTAAVPPWGGHCRACRSTSSAFRPAPSSGSRSLAGQGP